MKLFCYIFWVFSLLMAFKTDSDLDILNRYQIVVLNNSKIPYDTCIRIMKFYDNELVYISYSLKNNYFISVGTQAHFMGSKISVIGTWTNYVDTFCLNGTDSLIIFKNPFPGKICFEENVLIDSTSGVGITGITGFHYQRDTITDKLIPIIRD